MSENNFSEEEGTQLRSAIACHVCRKRKVKCGREMPQCSLCQQSLQVCEYARKPLRPGPKIGSTQNPRKRKNRTLTDSLRTSPHFSCFVQQTSARRSIPSKAQINVKRFLQ
ncbi:hypothetical protein H2202_002069 [Exophiala xenobiotica]|nr:hypothetical protein H2202_002069 [Exophiala xenobiotica]